MQDAESFRTLLDQVETLRRERDPNDPAAASQEGFWGQVVNLLRMVVPEPSIGATPEWHPLVKEAMRLRNELTRLRSTGGGNADNVAKATSGDGKVNSVGHPGVELAGRNPLRPSAQEAEIRRDEPTEVPNPYQEECAAWARIETMGGKFVSRWTEMPANCRSWRIPVDEDHNQWLPLIEHHMNRLFGKPVLEDRLVVYLHEKHGLSPADARQLLLAKLLELMKKDSVEKRVDPQHDEPNRPPKRQRTKSRGASEQVMPSAARKSDMDSAIDGEPLPQKPHPVSIEAIAPAVIQSIKEATGLQKRPASEPTIIFLGNRTYRVDDGDPVVIDMNEDNVLQAFLKSPALLLAMLIDKSGVPNAQKILSNLTTKYNRRFAPAIRLPGGKARGGYHVRIQLGNNTSSP